ncbi:MAG: hypothetical protein ABR992_14590 [Solirubrobacteraceae bacterium]|jgi:hypothetical protein
MADFDGAADHWADSDGGRDALLTEGDAPSEAADPRAVEILNLIDERQRLLEQRDEARAGKRQAARARASAQADLQEEGGRKAAEEARLKFEEAEATHAVQEAAAKNQAVKLQKALERETEARADLSALEIEHTKRRTKINRRIAELTADEDEREAVLEQLDGQLTEVTRRLDRLEADQQAARGRELEEKLEELAPVVEAQREVIGASGTVDLSKDYITQADAHARSWKVWGLVLVGVAAITAACGLLLFGDDKVPAGAITGPTIVELVRNLFVIGLLLYGVRVSSLQFRVHRHLEAVARNKAAALATFNRIVTVASEKEVRNSLAIVLAQAVFNSDETGFIEAGQDQVTLIERLAASVPRIG